MAEGSIFWTTGGAGDGASAYTQAQVTDWLRRTFLSNAATEGVLAGYANSLAVSGTSSPVSVATGAAVVYGFPYENTSAVSLTVPTPTIGTTGHRVVLRANWTARTVRIALVSSSNGVATPPALTQSAGTTWEVSLATLSITTGGVITVTDTRAYAHFATRLDRSQVDGLGAGRIPFAASTGRLTDSAALTWDTANERLGVGTASPSEPLHSVISINGGAGARIANTNAGSSAAAFLRLENDQDQTSGLYRNSQANTGYAGVGSMNLVQVAARAIGFVTSNVLRLIVTAGGYVGINQPSPAAELDVVGNILLDSSPVPNLSRRQGGSATDWSAPGTSSYTPGTARMQCGTFRFSIASGVTVTFPTAFSQPPVVFATPKRDIGYSGGMVLAATGVSASGFTVGLVVVGGTIDPFAEYDIFWLAIGPE